LDSSELWNKSLDILSRREHSISELKTKLKKFDPTQSDLNDVIQRLIESNFLNDQRFAAAFIRSKSDSGYGPNYISQYLRKKGIESDQYDMFSLEIDWEEKCLTQFNKKSRNSKLDFKEKEKILRFLAYRGFSYEIIKNALKEFD
jgi:regulatory protein|tara:strand:+ start:239 stop:673 length:435 start_codon:yes stop_codon:yes gene_type:complete